MACPRARRKSALARERLAAVNGEGRARSIVAVNEKERPAVHEKGRPAVNEKGRPAVTGCE